MAKVSSDAEQISAWFESAANQLGAFDLIPRDDRLHEDRVICGILKLASLMGEPDRFWLTLGAKYSEIRLLGVECLREGLTKRDSVYLVRCGISFDSDAERFVVIV